MRKNTLYTVNPWNQVMFTRPTSGRIKDRRSGPANVNRSTQNIFDGFTASDLAVGNASVLDSSLNTNAINNSITNTTIRGFTPSGPKGANLFKGLQVAGKSNPLIGGAANMVGGAVGKAGYKLLSNGLNSGAGATVNKIGSAVGGVIGKANPVLGAAVTAAAGIIGGGVNALVGTAVDQVKLAEAKQGTSQLNSFTSSAANFDAIKGATAVANVQDAYRGGALKKDWASKHNAEIKRQRTNAMAFVDRSVDNNAENLAEDQLSNALSGYAAYGGLLRTKRKRNRRMNKRC